MDNTIFSSDLSFAVCNLVFLRYSLNYCQSAIHGLYEMHQIHTFPYFDSQTYMQTRLFTTNISKTTNISRNLDFSHDQFVSSSDIFQIGGSAKTNAPLSSTDHLTSKYLGQILSTITNLLRHFLLLDGRTQIILVDWLQKLAMPISDQLKIITNVCKVFICY